MENISFGYSSARLAFMLSLPSAVTCHRDRRGGSRLLMCRIYNWRDLSLKISELFVQVELFFFSH